MEVATPVAGFLDALVAKGPHPSLDKHAETYAPLIGSWTGQYEDRLEDGKVENGQIEVHLAWALDGRAVQDLWISPTRAERPTYE